VSYVPKQGDIVIVNFSPQIGHEQHGRRPGLIVSNAHFHKQTKMALLCPITNTITKYPTHINLSGRASTNGEVMCEQVRCLEVIARGLLYVETVPDDILEEAIDLVCSFVE